MTLDPTLFDGMDQAAAHADREEPGWTDRALAYLLDFAGIQAEFIGEDVARWAHENGLPSPTDSRAWGYTHYSADGIMHIVRYHAAVNPERDGGFKINNNFVALYARKLVAADPSFAGFFAFRVRRTA